MVSGLNDGNLSIFDRKPWLKEYPPYVKAHLNYPDTTLPELLNTTAQKYPAAIATNFMGGILTFKELAELVDRFATALQAMGVKKGDKISIMLPNCPQSVITYYGALKAGAIVIQTNPMYVERELEHQLLDSNSETIVILDLLYERLKRIRDRVPVKNVIVTSLADYLPLFKKGFYYIKQLVSKNKVDLRSEKRIIQLKKLLKEFPPSPIKVEIDPENDAALFQYTGGTTGLPKGVILTHKNLIANICQLRAWYPNCEEAKERILSVLPFFHVYGMTTAMNFSVLIAASLILLPRFQLKEVLKTIKKYKPSFFPGTPTIYVAINSYKKVNKYPLSSIKVCISGAAPLPHEVKEKFEKLTGGKIVEGYGLSEAAPVTHCNPFIHKGRIGSVGVPWPDVECRIVDPETGQEKQVNEPGELIVRGPQVMKGYHNRPDETKEVLKDGWLYTGDIASMDEDGYFYILDRKKDIIIAGGYNIYPREIEEVIYSYPKVKEAVVVGIPDEYRGETVKAYIVLQEGESCTAKELQDFCRQKLAAYKIPRIIEFRSELPKTISGKILRRNLLDEEKQKLQKQAADLNV